jgi:ABC-type nitrate/sulfonate/bicarbonate transport system substrate-binding protein
MAIATAVILSCVSLNFSKVSAAEKLTGLYSSYSVSYSLPWIARELGIFRKYNLEPDLVYIPSSGIATAALLSGQVDVALAGGVGFVRAFAQGATDLVFIGGFKNYLTFSILGKPEIQKPEDLKGKRIGITRLGSNSHYFLVQLLRRFGIDPVKDVNITQTGSETEVLAALANGAIDAGTMPPPLDARALAQGFRYVYVAYGPDVGIPYPAANIVTRRPTLEKRSAILGQFLRALAEASKVLHTDKESSYKVFEKLFRVNDRKLVEHAYNAEIKVMERRLDIKLPGIQAVLDDTAKTDPRAAKIKAQDLVDRRYLDEMEQSGFFKRIWADS